MGKRSNKKRFLQCLPQLQLLGESFVKKGRTFDRSGHVGRSSSLDPGIMKILRSLSQSNVRANTNIPILEDLWRPGRDGRERGDLTGGGGGKVLLSNGTVKGRHLFWKSPLKRLEEQNKKGLLGLYRLKKKRCAFPESSEKKN